MNGFAAGRIAGVPIFLHSTFVVLVALYAVGFFRFGSPEYIIVGVFAVVGGVGSILLHELAHAMAARLCGLAPLYIELNGLGGACHYNRAPMKRADRVFISLAGPAANLALWGLFYWLSHWTMTLVSGADDLAEDTQTVSGWFRLGMSLYMAFSTLASLNIGLFVFNMLPSFPLDGGKALSEFFAAKFDLATGTRVIATCGFLVCAYCVYMGLTTRNTWTLVLAYSLFLANQQAMATLGQRRWRRWD